MSEWIRIKGARQHNLQNVDVDFPRGVMTAVSGLSGSGKSSLVFDTLYAEGQRCYVESLSTYARQFLARLPKPEVDWIDGISPAIAIEQRNAVTSGRSTVGTVTEINDYLRVLWARAGRLFCPDCDIRVEKDSPATVWRGLRKEYENGARVLVCFPLVIASESGAVGWWEPLLAQGFQRAVLREETVRLDEAAEGALPVPEPGETIDVVVDRLKLVANARSRFIEAVELALEQANGQVAVRFLEPPSRHEFSSDLCCNGCGRVFPEPTPRLFSFNNPAGACPSCDGLGVEQFFDPAKVVLHPEISLAGGAIRGWDRRNAYYFQTIRALGQHHGFDPETPWAELPETARQVVLYGSGETELAIGLPGRGSGAAETRRPFEGVIRNMERRYRETDSSTVREELARYISQQPCPACAGTRLNRAARHVFVAGWGLPDLTGRPIGEALTFLEGIRLPGSRGEIGAKVIKEIASRLRFLVDVGLDYLTLERSADSLSGGEAQRIRLASQIGAGLVGVMYILDEPSIGLHQRDNGRLLRTLTQLRDLGNTVIVVEHDDEAIRRADLVVDLGPGAGAHGGEIVAVGPAEAIAANPASLTGRYLAGNLRIPIPTQRTAPKPDRQLRILGACGNNLRAVDAAIPIGTLCCVTGVSGSGKSTLINDTLFPAAARQLNGASLRPAEHQRIEGLEHFDKVVDIDQSPIGRTPRSNPATYTGVFNMVRELFAAVPEARSRGYGPGRFSFNVKGGRCEACKGDGLIRVEMHFLPDIYVQCDSCQGRRYNRETLEIRYKGKTIDEVLNLTIEEARSLFAPVAAIHRRLQTLIEVGLGYVRLGQSATTLSGGEAQRVKLSRELSKRDTGRTLYILDEPTTGLHFHDIKQLLDVLHRLRDRGNTVVIIEHNLDVIKTADWVIDLGPEGGDKGGTVVTLGSPEQIAAAPGSHTGRFLKPLLERGW